MRKLMLISIFTNILFIAFAQTRTIRGVVENAVTGETIANIEISVYGSDSMAISDRYGNYILEVPDTLETIEFKTFYGYYVGQILKEGKDVVNITLIDKYDYLASLTLLELSNLEVSTVSRVKQKQSIASAYITVVTRNDIINSGARNILDIIRQVPGFYSSVNQFGLHEIGIRGFKSTNTPTLKLLINGQSVNNNVFGEATRIFDDMPVDNIERIEIVRGPNSAVYGSNAMLSVINIITIQDSKYKISPKLSYGSFNTFDFSIVSANKLAKDISYSFFMSLCKSDGAQLTIEEDRLSEASYGLTPHGTDHSKRRMGAHLRFDYKGVQLNSIFSIKERGPFIGPSYALVERGAFKNKGKYWLNSVSKSFNINTSFSITPNIYFKQMYFSPDGQIFPSGFGHFDAKGEVMDINGDGIYDIFPAGMIAKYELADNLIGAEVINKYTPCENHQVTFGILGETIWLTNLHTRTNFAFNSAGEPYYLGEFKNFEEGIVNASERTLLSVFAQDTWKVFDEFHVTIGSRFDEYSDFGSSFSPRIGVSHSLINNSFTYKLLYGNAFRAPSFGELNRTNNVNVVGNPDLDPEIVDTYEAGVEMQLWEWAKVYINYFHIDMKGFINRVPNKDLTPGQPALTYDNASNIRSQGIETELKIFHSKGLYSSLNYTYQSPHLIEEAKHIKVADIPNHLANFIINYKPLQLVNINVMLNYIGKRERREYDRRAAIPERIWGALALNVTDKGKKLNVGIGIYNLFDTKYFDPGHAVFVPTDYPRPGINLQAKLQYHY